MSNPNSLRYLLSEESREVVDHILGPFLESRIGENDLAIANGLIASAAVIIATHCQQTGEDFKELADLCRQSFDLALEVAHDRIDNQAAGSTEHER